MLIGFGYDLWRGGWNGTAFFISGTGIPLVVLGWLFYFRMLGSGDIKLFCVLGGIIGTSTYSVVYLVCISDRRAAFTGHSDLVRRFQPANPILVKYMKTYIRTGERKAYYRNGTAWENIHFTVPVFMSVMSVCRRYVLKKQIFAVCDLEAEYACNFMDYLNQKKNIPFEIQALPVWKVWWHM